MERLTCTEAAEGFRYFWDAYPVKQHKMASERVWRHMHLMNELTADLVETILKAVRAQVKWEQWRRGFIPSPARWLEDRRWEDEERPKPEFSGGRGAGAGGRKTVNTFDPSTVAPLSAEEAAKRDALWEKHRKTRQI